MEEINHSVALMGMGSIGIGHPDPTPLVLALMGVREGPRLLDHQGK